MTVRGILVWMICALFLLYEFLLRTVLGTYQVPIMQDLHLSAVQFSLMSSTAYQITYGLMQLPVGFIADRLGLKKTLLLAAIICVVANIGFSLVSDYRFALFFRLLMGLGSSFGFICLLLAVYDWLPRKKIAFYIGVSQFIGTMGPMLAAGPLNGLLEANILGWRGLFFVLAVAGGVLAFLVFLFVEKNQESEGAFYILSRPLSMLSNLNKLIRQKQIWWIGIYSSSIYFSLEYLTENEGTSFLISKGLTPVFSSYLITISWLGYAIGCPLLGYLSDKLRQRKPIMFFSALSVLISLCAIIYLPLNPAMMLIFFFLLGIGASGPSIGFAIMSEHCEPSSLTVGLAFNNSFIMFFGAIVAPVIGLLLTGKGHIIHPLADYQEVFSVLIFCTLPGVLLSAFCIKETFCKSVHENTILTRKF